MPKGVLSFRVGPACQGGAAAYAGRRGIEGKRSTVTALIVVTAVLGGAASAQAVSDFEYQRNSVRVDSALLGGGLVLLLLTLWALVVT